MSQPAYSPSLSLARLSGDGGRSVASTSRTPGHSNTGCAPSHPILVHTCRPLGHLVSPRVVCASRQRLPRLKSKQMFLPSSVVAVPPIRGLGNAVNGLLGKSLSTFLSPLARDGARVPCALTRLPLSGACVRPLSADLWSSFLVGRFPRRLRPGLGRRIPRRALRSALSDSNSCLVG